MGKTTKFKQTKIGELPEDWQVNEIGEHFEVNTGKGIHISERVLSGDYPIMGANGIIGYTNKFLVDGEYILTGRVGTLGEIAFKAGKFWISDNSIYIASNSRENLRFLYYYLKTFDFHVLNVGSTQPLVKQSDIKKIKFPYPPLKEQDSIAKILSDLDEKIELNHQMNKTLEAIAQAIFKQWFVDFEPWGGKQPEDWQNYTLGDISTLSAGGDRPKISSEEPSITCTIPIYSNGIDNDGLYGYTNEAKIIDESVTVSARGTIGFTCLRQVPYFPIVRLISLVPNPKYLSAKYLYLWLKNINISGTGTTQQQLTVPDFKKTEILIPTPEIMKRFTVIVNSMFAQITANKNENATITSIRDSILPKLTSGKIRVNKNKREVILGD